MSRTIVTPQGTCRYPHVNEPSKTFSPEGVYTCDLIVSEEDAQQFATEVEKILNEAHADEQKKKGKKINKANTFPVQQQEDGSWIIKTKQKAEGTNRKGEKFVFSVKIFDQNGSPINDNVGGGTVAKCAVEPRTWFTPTLGFGITLNLRAVQVLDLVAPSQQGSAESFGFTSEESSIVSGGESFEDAIDNGDF